MRVSSAGALQAMHQVHYLYSRGLGLWVKKIDSSGTINYATDGAAPASDVLADTNATYTPGLSERRSGTSKFYHSDALGSTRGITNTSQSATDAVLYDAFGNVVS